jgi:hypothetical protein
MTGWLRNQFGVADAAEDAAQAAQLQARGYEDASNAESIGIQEGANMSIDGMTDAMNFLRQREQIPMQMRDQALGGLQQYYGAGIEPMIPTSGIKSQEELLMEARKSPMYSAVMSQRDRGEEAIARTAGATGGLRSGNTIEDMANFNADIENRALMSGYGDAVDRDIRQNQRNDLWIQRNDLDRLNRIQGMEGMANYSGYDRDIANLYAGMGATRGGARASAGRSQADAIRGSSGAHSQGQVAASQIQQQGNQNAINTILGGVQGFVNAGGIPGVGALFSDIRLKDDIRFIGEVGGINIYGWTWNERAKQFGLEGECSGVMAHEVFEKEPAAISEEDGFIKVDYSKIPFEEKH